MRNHDMQLTAPELNFGCEVCGSVSAIHVGTASISGLLDARQQRARQQCLNMTSARYELMCRNMRQ